MFVLNFNVSTLNLLARTASTVSRTQSGAAHKVDTIDLDNFPL